MPSKRNRPDDELWAKAQRWQDEYEFHTAALSAVRRLRQRDIIKLAQYHSIPEIALELGISEATVWSIFYNDYSDKRPGRPLSNKKVQPITKGKKRV